MRRSWAAVVGSLLVLAARAEAEPPRAGLPAAAVRSARGVSLSGALPGGTAQAARSTLASFTVAGELLRTRPEAFAVSLLPDGRLLVAGGDAAGTAERLDPLTGRASPAASLRRPRRDHSLIRLRDGRLLVVGGRPPGTPDGSLVVELELYDPQTDTFTLGPTLPEGILPTPVALLDDRVLFGGGSEALAFDPDTGQVAPAATDDTAHAGLIPLLVAAPGGWAGGEECRYTRGYEHRAVIREADGAWRFSPWAADYYNRGCWPPRAPWATPSGRVYTYADWSIFDSRLATYTGGSVPPEVASDAILVSNEPEARRGAGTLALPARGASTAIAGLTVVLMGTPTCDGCWEAGTCSACPARIQLCDLGRHDCQVGPTAGGTPGLRPVLEATSTTQVSVWLGDAQSTLAVEVPTLVPGPAPGQPASEAPLLVTPRDRVSGAWWRRGTAAQSVSLGPLTVVAALGANAMLLLSPGGAGSAPALSLAIWGSPGTVALPPPAGMPTAATTLADGSVLLTGHGLDPAQPYAERVTEDGRVWPLPAPAVPRDAHTATLLRDGRVLLAGGSTDDRLEVFDAATGAFSVVARLPGPREGHAAALLPGGEVFLGGGSDPRTGEAVLEVLVFDPATNEVRPFGDEPAPRPGATSVAVRSARVWIAGGEEGGAPTSGTALLVVREQRRDPGAPLRTPRAYHTVTTLADGRVLVAGGGAASAEVYDPLANATLPGPALLAARAKHTATLLPGGRVLLAGGEVEGEPVATAELVDLDGGATAAATLRVPRAGHQAVLLNEGTVLFLGGDGGVGSAEIYDPRSGSTAPFQLPYVSDHVAAAPLPSGEVLVAAEGYTYRLAAGPNAVTGLHVGVSRPMAIVAPRPGLHQVCGLGECMGEYAGVPGSRSAHPITSHASLTALPTGQYLLHGLTATGSPASLRAGDLSERVVPPTLRAAGELVPGTTVTLTGTRFRQPTAVGSEQSGEWVDAIPTVYWVSANHGVTVPGYVEHYSNTELQWRVPSSPYHGPGWLHVVVMGVPSQGFFAPLGATPDGEPCTVGALCASGSCVDGVCCDRACDQGCEACTASATGLPASGVCGPLAAGAAPRFGCARGSGDVCGPTGLCDGSGSCALPPTTTRCALASQAEGVCLGGRCVDPPDPICDARGERLVAATGEVTACEPYACRDGACLGQCQATADCAEGFTCTAGSTCTTCSADGSQVLQPSGVFEDCAGGYRCVAGACLDTCRSTFECTGNRRCTADGRCEASLGLIEAAVDPGACAVARPAAERRTPGALAAASAAALALALRRSRAALASALRRSRAALRTCRARARPRTRPAR